MATKSLCAVDGCGKPTVGRGWCVGHYNRWRRHGDVQANVPLLENHPEKDQVEWLQSHRNHQSDECLVWPYSKFQNGYGKIRLNGGIKIASRMMCIEAHGEPPTPLHQAAHSCGSGNLGCVNPRHLRWATVRENQSDRTEHGRDLRGEQNGSSKLTAAQVRRIRKLRGVVRQSDLAAQFGVSQSAIAAIHVGRTWGCLG